MSGMFNNFQIQMNSIIKQVELQKEISESATHYSNQRELQLRTELSELKEAMKYQQSNQHEILTEFKSTTQNELSNMNQNLTNEIKILRSELRDEQQRMNSYFEKTLSDNQQQISQTLQSSIEKVHEKTQGNQEMNDRIHSEVFSKLTGRENQTTIETELYEKRMNIIFSRLKEVEKSKRDISDLRLEFEEESETNSGSLQNIVDTLQLFKGNLKLLKTEHDHTKKNVLNEIVETKNEFSVDMNRLKDSIRREIRYIEKPILVM